MEGFKQDYINYRIEKSEEVYQDAILLANNKRWNSSVNRLYYSSFYLVSALLYQYGYNAKTHNGAKTQFFQHFVKSELTKAKYGELYATLFDWRQESDYVDFIEFEKETVHSLLDEVKEFNNELKRLIQKA